MKVKELLAYFNIENDSNDLIFEVSDDSKFNHTNWAYINISSKTNAQEYILEARKNQAKVILSIHKIEGVYFVPDLKDKLLKFLYFFYQIKPKCKIIGITGTNGKSSLSDFLKQSLLLLKYKVKNVTCKRNSQSYFSSLTTPTTFELFKIVKKANNERLDYLILEVSSIAISEKRINGLEFDYLFLTNLKKDHLDYHKSIQNYHLTKIGFIKNSNAIKFIPQNINIETDKLVKIRYYIRQVNENNVLYINKKKIDNNLIFKTNMINASYVYYFLLQLKIDNKLILETIKQLKTLKGRMDIISNEPKIIIDYAHTSSSFRNIVVESKKLFKRPLILLFGAGGNRDLTKRKEYAKIANRYANLTILTNDNPRGEEPLKIINSMGDYIENKIIIMDRKQAIKYAISLLKDEVLLILGKGDEDYIIYENYQEYHNDYDEVKKCLNKIM